MIGYRASTGAEKPDWAFPIIPRVPLRVLQTPTATAITTQVAATTAAATTDTTTSECSYYHYHHYYHHYRNHHCSLYNPAATECWHKAAINAVPSAAIYTWPPVLPPVLYKAVKYWNLLVRWLN